MTIAQLPTPPSKSDPVNFATRADEFLGALPAFGNEVNAVALEIDANALSASNSASASAVSAGQSASSATNAEAFKDAAASTLNYKGEWSSLTGALNVPSTVTHLNQVWMLKNNLANVTTSNPSTDTTNWIMVSKPSKPDIKPSLSVDWTLKPTAASLISAGWTITRTGEMTSFGAIPVKAAENLFSYSQDFTNGAWTKTRVALSVVTDESGLVGSLLIPSVEASANHYMLFNALSTNIGSANYRVRFLCKAATHTKAFILDPSIGRAAAAFDLATGTVIGTGLGPGYISHSMTPHELGGGLHWCELVMTSSAAGVSWNAAIVGYPDSFTPSSAGSAIFTGDGVSGIEVYAAQLQQNFDGNYLPTTVTPITLYEQPLVTTAANELAYQHNSNGECIGLVQYPADTNIILQSQDLGNASWVKDAVSVTVTKRKWANVASFYRLVKTDAAANQAVRQNVTIAIPANTKYSCTIALLADQWSNTTTASVGVFGVANSDWGSNADSVSSIISGPGTVVQSAGGLFDVSNLSFTIPTLVKVTRTFPIVDTATGVRIYPGTSASTTLGAAILATRVHISASPRLMPYIPTTTAAVTRGTQTVEFGGSAFAAVDNPAQGTLLVKASVEDAVFDSSRTIAQLQTGSATASSHRVGLSSNAATALVQAYTIAFGVTQASDTNIGSISTASQTIAYSFASNSFSPAMNGMVDVTDVSGVVPSVDRLQLGQSGAYLIQRTDLYPRAMTSAELAAITTRGVL